MANRHRLVAVLAILSLATSACSTGASPSPSTAPSAAVSPAASAAASAAPSPSPSQAANENYPRAETLYTTGKQWGPPSTWNPLDPNAATGVVGLQYETLFLYDPLADKWTPWLAEGGTWTDPTTYTIKVRQGVKWSDGQALTAADVASPSASRRSR
jgi:peptide/nickel transport system substrate-binding protein